MDVWNREDFSQFGTDGLTNVFKNHSICIINSYEKKYCNQGLEAAILSP